MFVSIQLIAQEFENSNNKKTQFGITASYVNATAKVKFDSDDSNLSNSVSESGFSLGVSLQTSLSDDWSLQPSLQYAFVENAGFLFVPIMIQYYVTEEFNVMAGPQGTFDFEDKYGLPINTFGLDLSFGAGYDFDEHFYLEARYALELTNRTPDGINVSFIDDGFDPLITDQRINLNTKLNSIHVTLGYRF